MLIDTLPYLYSLKTVDAAGAISFRTDILTLSLMTASGSGYIFYLRFCMYVIPYGCCFAEEYGNSAAKYRITRSSGRVYGASKFATGVLLTAGTILAAELVFTLILKAQGVAYLLPQTSEYDTNYYMYRLGVTPYLLPHFFSGGTYQVYGKLMLVILMCNVPFLDRTKLYSVTRTERISWGFSQIIYIVIANLLFQGILFCDRNSDTPAARGLFR